MILMWPIFAFPVVCVFLFLLFSFFWLVYVFYLYIWRVNHPLGHVVTCYRTPLVMLDRPGFTGLTSGLGWIGRQARSSSFATPFSSRAIINCYGGLFGCRFLGKADTVLITGSGVRYEDRNIFCVDCCFDVFFHSGEQEKGERGKGKGATALYSGLLCTKVALIASMIGTGPSFNRHIIIYRFISRV